jgi:nitroimidazol reductase NimA-like FMN-containing flavoprotein (pyridoxamine 5'-phosphate oxidase superfamily)
MSIQTNSKEYVINALQTNGFAVLTTEGNGQPHACFIAITPMDDFTSLIFVTYRNTRKYNNLKNNNKVAVLFENRSTISNNQPDIIVLTAFGFAEELDSSIHSTALNTHLLKHPDLESFILSVDTALFKVIVTDYEIIKGIDDIDWWKISR